MTNGCSPSTRGFSLSDALQAATVTFDLNEACKIIQDTLGVTDGGAAGMFFSENELENWSFRDVPYRNRRLIESVGFEMDHMKASKAEADRLEAERRGNNGGS